MRKTSFLLVFTLFLTAAAFAEQWNKSYQVGDRPSIRVETNDAAIEVTAGASKTVSARVLMEGYKQGDVRITERQDGDRIDMQVHLPNQWGLFMGPHRVRIELQVPPDTALDLHSGDGHISIDSTSGTAKIDTGDGSITVRNYSGSLDAHTGDGHISADGVFSAVALRTGDGHVDFTARPGSKITNSWLIHTSDGRVEARLPGDLAAELYAHTGDGHITLGIPVVVDGSMERSRVRGKMNGGGPLLEIATGDGSIHLDKY